MTSTKLSRYEQETIVNYNNEEKTASVFTCDPVVQRKLDKYVNKYPDVYKCVKVTQVAEGQFSKEYEIANKKLVSFRPPVVMTEARREACRANFARLQGDKND